MSSCRWTLVLLFVLPAVCATEAAQERAALPKTQERNLAQLIGRLGSTQPAERQEASAALEKIGEPALPALRKALKNDDAEIRRAARELIDTIEGQLAKEARAAIKKAGGTVEKLPDNSKILVVFLDVGKDSKATDDTLRYVRYLGNVGEVSLAGDSFTDAALLHFEGMTTIYNFRVRGAQFSDNGLKTINTLTKLQRLSLYGPFTDTGLSYLRDLSELEVLGIGGTKITDKGLVHLAHMPKLGGLSLDVPLITVEGLKHLKDLEHLTELYLADSSVTDDGLASLKELKHLKLLDLDLTNVSDKTLASLKDMKTLKRLSLIKTKISGPGLAYLKEMSELEELNLMATPLKDEGLAHLKSLKNLKKLYLSSTLVTDEGLVHLRGLVKLEQVALAGSRVTDKGVADLRKALPGAMIDNP